MPVNEHQIRAVLALPAPKKFEHFVKEAAAWEKVWGLYQDGWALAGDEGGVTIFPLWPAKEYAALCAQNEWVGFEPREIPLDEFMSFLLPKLKSDGFLPGLIYTPSNQGVTPPVDELLEALNSELTNY